MKKKVAQGHSNSKIPCMIIHICTLQMYVQLDRSSKDTPPPLQLLLLQNIKDNSLSAFSQCKNNSEKDAIKMRLITTFTLKGESLY